ncbi:MAG: Holliday junction branch migration protein RuvA [Oscillospiraceae bacterium]|nr:Holliday junction branch migration protein RuvA [Oscillospiraceae bacterium]
MIYSVKGALVYIDEGLAVVECAGVGYACRTASATLDGLKLGDNVTLLTHLSVREDAVELFGFATAHELGTFKMLLSVSGVGPKAALSILSDMSPQDFALSVVTDDVKSLTRVKGIGSKTAQLIILKLKDKLSSDATTTIAATPQRAATSKDSQALSALMVLGFTASESAQALAGLTDELDTSEKIKRALKKLSKG